MWHLVEVFLCSYSVVSRQIHVEYSTYGKDLLGTFIADLTLQVLSFAAQLERENIRQRQAEGIASAKARGVRFGRKKKELPEDFDIWFVRWRSGEITGKQMAAHCGMEISVLYRKLREAGIPLDRNGGQPV